MIHIDLHSPIILFSQLPALAEELGVELLKLKALTNSGKSVITEDISVGEGENSMSYHKGDILTDKELADLQTQGDTKISVPHLYGSEAVVWLCNFKQVECTAITSIDLKRDVFYEASGRQWIDISYAAARVESWNDRFARLKELDAPEIILRNEVRMLRERVEILESNRYGRPELHKDGTLCRALNDIGYSLLHGWDKEMLEEFERRNAKLEREREQAKAEAEANAESSETQEGEVN